MVSPAMRPPQFQSDLRLWSPDAVTNCVTLFYLKSDDLFVIVDLFISE